MFVFPFLFSNFRVHNGWSKSISEFSFLFFNVMFLITDEIAMFVIQLVQSSTLNPPMLLDVLNCSSKVLNYSCASVSSQLLILWEVAYNCS